MYLYGHQSVANISGNLSTTGGNSFALISGHGAGTVSGSNALDTVSNMSINGTLNFEATADTTFNTIDIAGTLNHNSTNNLTLTDLVVGANNNSTLSGSGAGLLTVTNSPTITGTLNINRSVTFTNNISSIGTSGLLSGSGTIVGDIISTGGNGGSIKPRDS